MGSYAYVPALDELLTEAWERCGLSPSIMTGDVLRSARRSLQLMLIDWTNMGANLWQIEPVPLVLTPGQAMVTLAPELVDVLQATVSWGGADLTMTGIGRDDYVSIPVKTTAGRPTQFWVQRAVPSAQLFLYPTPDQAYAVTAYCLRQPQDVVGFAAGADVPLLFAEAVTAGLAVRMAVKFAPLRVQLLQPLADAAFRKATGEDRERVPLKILPRLSR